MQVQTKLNWPLVAVKISAVLVHPRDQRILSKECDFSDSGYKVVLVYTFHWQYHWKKIPRPKKKHEFQVCFSSIKGFFNTT